MSIILYVILTISLLLGIISFFNYVNHPLSGTNMISYSGTKFWFVSFIIILALFLKG